MARLDDDEDAATGRAKFSGVRAELAFDDGPIFGRLQHFGPQAYRPVGRRRAQEFDVILGGDGAGRGFQILLFHESISRRPVAVTVQERPDDAAVEGSGEGLMMGLGLPFRDDFFPARETANMEPASVGRSTAVTYALRSVGLLQAFHSRDYSIKQCGVAAGFLRG